LIRIFGSLKVIIFGNPEKFELPFFCYFILAASANLLKERCESNAALYKFAINNSENSNRSFDQTPAPI